MFQKSGKGRGFAGLENVLLFVSAFSADASARPHLFPAVHEPLEVRAGGFSVASVPGGMPPGVLLFARPMGPGTWHGRVNAKANTNGTFVR